MLGMNSCFLISVPVKATGEIIEKSAEATGRAATRGIRRATTPSSQDGGYAEDSVPSGAGYDEYGYPEEGY